MAKRSIDYTLLILTFILVLFGVIMVFSASYYYAENNPYAGNDAFYYFWTQLSGAAIGIVILIFAIFFDYNRYKKLRYIILAIGFLLMVLVFVPGIGIIRNGSRRWVNLRIIDIQSIEVLKFAIIIFMAGSIANNQNRMHTFRYGMTPYLILLLAAAVLLYFQPNFSAVITLALLMFVMMLIGGANLWHFLLMGAIGIGAGAIAMISTEYRMDRIFAYMDPWKYASDKGYQLIQSLYSIGSGGFFGLGLGNSRQKYLFLPYGESDCIFAIIVEELGFLGGLLVIAAFALLIWRGVRIALRAPNMFGLMLASGITALIAIQVFVNVGVVTGLVPPTGVVLPFISAGRTSLLMFLGGIGILLNISRQTNKI